MYNEGFSEVEHAYRAGRALGDHLRLGTCMMILFFGFIIGMGTAALLGLFGK